jgi:hypothetical protein
MQSALDDVASTIRQPLANVAGHVIGCRLSLSPRIQSALDDVACTIRQALFGGSTETVTEAVRVLVEKKRIWSQLDLLFGIDADDREKRARIEASEASLPPV